MSERIVFADGERPLKVKAMIELARETWGREPTAEERAAISVAVRAGETELPEPVPPKEERMEKRVTELLEENTRRDLEAMVREVVGVEPTKAEFPNMEALAKAIVAKEFEEAEPT